MVMNFYIDEKDEERERARLSRDGEGRAFHPTPPPTPSHLNEVRAHRPAPTPHHPPHAPTSL